MPSKNLRFEWERAILSSTLSPSTRFVALAMATHMSPKGEHTAGERRLSSETGLAGSTVRNHRKALIDQGWIRRELGPKRYVAGFPASLGMLPSEQEMLGGQHLGMLGSERLTDHVLEQTKKNIRPRAFDGEVLDSLSQQSKANPVDKPDQPRVPAVVRIDNQYPNISKLIDEDGKCIERRIEDEAEEVSFVDLGYSVYWVKSLAVA